MGKWVNDGVVLLWAVEGGVGTAKFQRRLFTYVFVFILLFSFTESAFCFHLRFGIVCFRVATTPIGALIRCYVTSRLS